MMWWWLMVLMIFLLLRDRRRRYSEELEGRLARVEDGLDFTERLLAERAAR